MMIITTMFLTVVMLVPFYFLVIKKLASPAPAYLILLVVGILCILGGSVHFVYVGVELLAFGSLLVWAHHRWWKAGVDASRQA